MHPDPQPNTAPDSNRSRGEDGRPVRDDRTTTPPAHTPAHTHQTDKDAAEQSRHTPSENALPTTQDKNPIPPGTTRSAES